MRPFHFPCFLLFFPLYVEVDDLFRIPGQGCPYNIGGIPNGTFVSASIHPVISLEVANDRFYLDPLFQGFFEPGFLTVRMRRFPLLWNGGSLDTPSPAF